MNPQRDGAMQLLDITMNDQSRLFYSGPEIRRPSRLMLHILTLPGAWPTAFLPGLDEAWIDFRYKGWKLPVHNHWGENWYFVSDRACPDAILEKAASHFAWLTKAERSADR